MTSPGASRLVGLPASVAVLAVVPAVVIAGPVKAEPARPKLLSAKLNSSNQTVNADGGCAATAVMTQRFSDPDKQITTYDVLPSVSHVATNADSQVDSKITRSGKITTITSTARQCGNSQPGKYRFHLNVRVADEIYIATQRHFALRYRPLISFNAAPEPVRAGKNVTVEAYVAETEGEGSVDTTVAFHFRPDGGKYTYQGKAKIKCYTVPESDGYCNATRSFRQTRSGTWKAVSAQTSRVASGSATDHVAVN